MRIVTINGQDYRLPNSLNAFQQEMYVHLINWKWAHITKEPGHYTNQLYDAILPDESVTEYPQLYPGIINTFKQHRQTYPFDLHKHFNHIVSSQAANVNLFLPILSHPKANAILATVKHDLANVATSELDRGFRIEFWDEGYGALRDKTRGAGTAADIGIAYHNHRNELCLWLIEHKLTEDKFTECGGYTSPKREPPRHDCGQSYTAILENKSLCYYHDCRRYRYWEITAQNRDFFANHAAYAHCPFKAGLNQLWRNQLLALSIEKDERQPYKHVFFSVVRHPRNKHLDESLEEYQGLIANNPQFSTFTSEDVVNAAAGIGDAELAKWIEWYRQLYKL